MALGCMPAKAVGNRRAEGDKHQRHFPIRLKKCKHPPVAAVASFAAKEARFLNIPPAAARSRPNSASCLQAELRSAYTFARGDFPYAGVQLPADEDHFRRLPDPPHP